MVRITVLGLAGNRGDAATGLEEKASDPLCVRELEQTGLPDCSHERALHNTEAHFGRGGLAAAKETPAVFGLRK